MAATGYECLRRDARLEVGIRERGSVRHFVQVGHQHKLLCSIADKWPRSALYGNERFKPYAGKLTDRS
jgi:hypothetical protein